MHALSEATGQLLNIPSHSGTDNVPIICGGTSGKKDSDECFRLDQGFFKPKLVGTMTRPRLGASSVTLFNGTTLWVTGGLSFSSIATDTTEWINLADNGQGTFYEGIPLPRPVSHHCLEMVDSETALLFGGVEGMSELDSDPVALTLRETWTLKSPPIKDRQKWSQMPRMPLRRYAMSCGVIKEDIAGSNFNGSNIKVVVVAAGGFQSHGEITDRVELYRVDQGQWQDGPRLPMPLARTSSTTSTDQTMLFVAGGITYADLNHDCYDWHSAETTISPTIFALRTARTSGLLTWIEFDLDLVFPRMSSVTMLLPPAFPEKTATDMNGGGSL